MNKPFIQPFGSKVEFANFGKQSFAYVRAIKSEEAQTVFPDSDALPSGLDLWGLFAADGRPLALADERSMVMDDARELDLMTLALH